MKKTHKIISILLVIVIMLTMAPISAFAVVSPSTVEIGGITYYKIRNAVELDWFASQVNSGNGSINAALANDIVYNSGTISASTTGASVWTPIGSRENPFTGIFNGQGYTISGLYSKDPDENPYLALFACTVDATVANVAVKNFYFESTYGLCAGLVSYSAGTTIYNCYAQGSIYAKDAGGAAGGICASVFGHNKTEILNCLSDVSLKVDDPSDFSVIGPNVRNYIGGIICMGDKDNPVFIQNSIYITDRYSGSLYSQYALPADFTIYDSEGMPASKLATGEITYILGDGWGQKLGTDSIPEIGNENRVDYGYVSCDANAQKVYTNSATNPNYPDHYDSETDSDVACDFCGTNLHTHSYNYTANGNVITATCSNSDGNCTDTNGGTLTISAPADLYADGTTAKKVVIDNQLVEAIDYTVTYSTADGKAPKTTGTYTASVTIVGATATVKFTLVKPNASVSTVPVANALTYNREAQALVTAGSSSDGEIQYSLDGATYSSDIPAATNAGDYTVYYKVIGDENHNDSEPATVTVTISPANIYDATVTQVNPLYYNGTMQYVELAVSFDGKTLVYMTDYFLVGRAGGTDAGTYNTTVIGQGNYKGEKTIEWYIEKATPTADMLVFTAPENLTYDGSEKSATVEASPEITGMGEITVKYSATPVNAGTYTVSIDVAEGSNYNAISDLEIGEFTIIKADNTVTAAPTPKTLTYNGKEQNLISEGSAENGTMVYSLNGEEYSETIPTGINAGEYTVYYKVIGDANHNDSEPETVTVTIVKKSVTAIATVADKVYDGTTDIDASAIEITFDGIVDGDDFEVSKCIGIFLSSNAGNNKTIYVAYDVSGKDVNNYDICEDGVFIPEKEYYYIETNANILPRDIADAQIVLGDALTYNGTEQTQSIAGVTVAGLEVTYTVSGNTAKNVGVYQLTVTGTGNFTGEAKITFEIAPDTTSIDALTVDNVKSTDKEAIEAVAKQIENALTDLADDAKKAEYKAITDKCNELLAKIDATADEIARIDEAVNSYDMETVTSADIPAFGKLIDDIKALTDGQNITDDEKAALEANNEAIDELVEKLTEVAEEIKRVDEAVKSYDEATVKSTDKADLEQLKEDIQALIDSTNTTENEKTALGGMLEKDNALIDVIDEIEQQIEDIGAFENNFNPEKVTSDDKAAIEEKIAEIENVNPDNLTEEQKAEYDEIKADLEALLEEIEKAGSEVDAIGAELEMFDEERVTIFSKDEIEALKAKIEELLADTNMGEAEKAKLNEYKAQCDNLIEIINTPAKYFSMRLFYFVWDAVNWLVNCIASIF